MAQKAIKRASAKIECVSALKALADLNRLRILDAVLTAPRPVSEIASACNLTSYNASRHLAILHRAGLVECQKDAQRRLYRISDACEVLVNRRSRTLDLKCCQFKLDTFIIDNVSGN